MVQNGGKRPPPKIIPMIAIPTFGVSGLSSSQI
jgi:hypothetical protein